MEVGGYDLIIKHSLGNEQASAAILSYFAYLWKSLVVEEDSETRQVIFFIYKNLKTKAGLDAGGNNPKDWANMVQVILDPYVATIVNDFPEKAQDQLLRDLKVVLNGQKAVNI